MLYEYRLIENQMKGYHERILETFAECFLTIQPVFFPMFSFHWMTLVSHRYFMPKLLRLKGEKGWPVFVNLLETLLVYVDVPLKERSIPPVVGLLYSGILRVLLVLHHDFLKFLAEWHFSICTPGARIPSPLLHPQGFILPGEKGWRRADWEYGCVFHAWSPTHTSQFLISLLVVFLITANMYSFRMVGVFSANLDVAIHITGVSIQALILGTRIVRGEDYIHTQFTYLWSHLWRNVGIIIAFWMFFAIMIAVDLRLRSRTAGVLEVIGGGPGHDGPTPPTTGNEPEADRAPKEFVVVVPYAGIPNLWRFVYWISPFKYLVSGFTGVLVHDVPVRCSKNELAKFNLPPNVANCAEYTADFVKRLGGYVEEENGV
ncbi:CCR4-Not complex component, Not1-domain-containing protein [Tuber borchii]|uniref:CCR4-Not complex component, Not1-domain-containing protein n=1 Tax=Tuber borchii TaxID=42251 RepID=A0A2T6ZIP9_TUBBO|nr:CCR4-Not complex component, Not1-domain-containing protein [Tuber borchii]